MAFRTEALPTQPCKNHKRTEQIESMREHGSIPQAMAANSRVSNKESNASFSS